jgi:hypothetical protein
MRPWLRPVGSVLCRCTPFGSGWMICAGLQTTGAVVCPASDATSLTAGPDEVRVASARSPWRAWWRVDGHGRSRSRFADLSLIAAVHLAPAGRDRRSAPAGDDAAAGHGPPSAISICSPASVTLRRASPSLAFARRSARGRLSFVIGAAVGQGLGVRTSTRAARSDGQPSRPPAAKRECPPPPRTPAVNAPPDSQTAPRCRGSTAHAQTSRPPFLQRIPDVTGYAPSITHRRRIE